MIRPYGIDTIRAEFSTTRLPVVTWQSETFKSSDDGDKIYHRGLTCVGDVRVGYRETKITASKPMMLTAGLWVEASLPKILRGNNVEALRESGDIARAIEKINNVVSSIIGWDADLTGWQLSRLDVTADRRFTPVSNLQVVLHRLASERIARTYPTIRPGSVTWSRKWGSASFVVYDKFRESGDHRASGLLRVECQAKGHGVIHRAYPEMMRPDTVTVGDLLDDAPTMAMQEALVAPIDQLIDKCAVDSPKGVAATVHHLLGQGVPLTEIKGILGIAVIVREVGWDAMAAHTTRQSIANWRRELRDAGVRPDELDFT